MNLPVLRLPDYIGINSAKHLYALTFLFLTFFIVQNATAQNCAGNLFNNAGFEQDFGNQTIGNGWEGYGGTTFSNDARSGQRAVQMAVSDYLRIWQFFPATPGQEYTASGYLKSDTRGTIGIKFLTADYQPDNLLTSRATNGNYTLVELTRTAPANAAWVEVSIYSNNDEVVLADDFCLTTGGGSSCQINASIFNSTCRDNGTPTDPNDDQYNVTIDASNTGGGSGYQLSYVADGVNKNFNGTYGTSLFIGQINISSGPLTMTLTDNSDPTCTTVVVSDPPSPCIQIDGRGDLRLSASGSPATIAAWQFGSSTFTVTNEGSEPVFGVEIAFDIAASARLKGGDEYNASTGTLQEFWTQTPVWTIGTLAGGQTETIELNIFTLSGGALPIYGQVSAAGGDDPDSFPNNGTPPTPNEDDEAVFTFNGGSTGSQPDLTFGNLFINNAPSAGEVLNYNFNLVNAGTATATGNFSIKSYISTDNVLSADDIQDGTIATGNVPVGTINTVPGASTLPANLPQGSYWLILKVDADDQITESNEGNNLVSAQFSTQGGGNSCAFVKSHETPGFDPPSVSSNFELTETASGYTVSTIIQTNFNPRTIVSREHELGLNGGLIDVRDIPVPPGLPPSVTLEVDTDKNLEMVFGENSDLPVGTRVLVDVGNADPTDVLAPSFAYRTANGGYAFGLGIIDTDMSPLLKNIMITTDNVGQNAQLYELPNPDFFRGFLPSIEGPDGSLFVRLTTSGNFSLYGIPAGGNAWNYRVASDTPSSTWRYTELSNDGRYIYTAKTDNFQTVVAKIEVATGNPTILDLSDLKTASPDGSFRRNYAYGITPTSDGGIVVSMGFDEVTGNPRLSGVIIAKYDAAGSQVWKNEFFTPQYDFSLTPVGVTSDGGILFVGTNRNGTTDNADDEAVFVKTTANGALTPNCDTGSNDGTDLELSFLTLNGPPPAQWGFFSTTLTVVNNGTENASGVSVKFNKADEVVYSGGDEFNASQGDFQYWGNEIWTVGNLAAGQSATLTVNYFRLSANPFVAFAEVETLTESDVDSTPGNGNCCTAGEDDEAALQIGSGAAQGVNNRTSLQGNIGEREVFAIISAAPNPTTGRFNLEVYSNENQSSEITVVDILGKPIFRKAIELNEGHNSIPIDLENRGTGMMMVKMTPFHPYLRQIRVMKVTD